MNRTRWIRIASVTAFVLTAPRAFAQNQARIGYLYPAGGRQGTTVKGLVGGQFLSAVSGAYVSGQGVSTVTARHAPPLTPDEANKIRTHLDASKRKLEAKAAANAQAKPPVLDSVPITPTTIALAAGITDEELQRLDAYTRRERNYRRQANPQLEDEVVLNIAIEPNAQPGMRDIRLITPAGVTNPLHFEVGEFPEYTEAVSKSTDPDPGIGANLPITINGQVLPGEVDRFAFSANKGTRLVASVRARALLPFIADAVPGWFQPVVAIYDSKGRELICTDHFLDRQDPAACCVIPADGSYVLVIRDTLFRGREDFVYRATLGEVPFVSSVFPLGGHVGDTTSVEVEGWNITQHKMTIDVAEAGVQRIRASAGTSVTTGFAGSVLPEVVVLGPRTGITNAHRVRLPIMINGRVAKPGDEDTYRFEGKAGSEIVAEVYARRLGSPLDSLLRLRDASGKQVAINDDWVDPGAGMLTHHADSRLTAKLPADGPYFLTLSDAQGNGGQDFGYRLRISHPTPDYELRLNPSSVNAAAGTTVPVEISVIRKEGFSGEVALNLKATAGFALGAGEIVASQDKARFTLTVPKTGLEQPYPLEVVGSAMIQGVEVRHKAVPVDDMTQAFAYHHLVPAADWVVAVTGKERTTPAIDLQGPASVKVVAGKPTLITLKGFGLPADAKVEYWLNAPPTGIWIKDVSSVATGPAIELNADPSRWRPGMAGWGIVQAAAQAPDTSKGVKPGTMKRIELGLLPAIAFEIKE